MWISPTTLCYTDTCIHLLPTYTYNLTYNDTHITPIQNFYSIYRVIPITCLHSHSLYTNTHTYIYCLHTQHSPGLNITKCWKSTYTHTHMHKHTYLTHTIPLCSLAFPTYISPYTPTLESKLSLWSHLLTKLLMHGKKKKMFSFDYFCTVYNSLRRCIIHWKKRHCIIYI